MTSLKTSIKTITYLSDIGCLEIQGSSLKASSTSFDNELYIDPANDCIVNYRRGESP